MSASIGHSAPDPVGVLDHPRSDAAEPPERLLRPRHLLERVIGLRKGLFTHSRPFRTALEHLSLQTGPLPRPTRRNLAFDVMLTLVLAGALTEWAVESGAGRVRHAHDGIAPFVGSTETGSVIVALALAGVATLPLALRRRYPLAVLWVVTGAAALTPHDAQRLVFYPCVVAAYSAAAYGPYRVATLASLPVTAVSVATIGTSMSSGPTSRYVPPTVPTQYVTLLILVPLVVAASGLRMWKLRADESRARMSALERERAAELRRAAEHERARIARELHDVVTHNVSVMVIQAGAARKVMDVAPDQAREALLAVEAGGRAAMAELRHAMGLLTMEAEGPEPAAAVDLAPQPGLDRLESLVGRVRESGVSVELTMTGPARALPSGVDLAAYRVVQEALTNTVKHAVGAKATVTVEYGADRLRVDVKDTGGTPDASATTTGNGRGLLGLRERLAVYGGTLDTGRRPTGGYRVTALIPLEA
ncbi:histidine kinase [Streptomyces sp. NBC_01340]|uniref:sensor histidine kinase n=1 Tax=Streptomyces sp. NBC_01340 TaxID=2903830 RepID=UPI002E12816B|nr:histidine kinase [Streptomyces sp. NBC_01340]